MTKKILKYPLGPYGITPLLLPMESTLLHVADQHGTLQLWVETSLEYRKEIRHIRVLHTGDDAPGELAVYLGTVLSQGGDKVSHVYDVTEVE